MVCLSRIGTITQTKSQSQNLPTVVSSLLALLMCIPHMFDLAFWQYKGLYSGAKAEPLLQMVRDTVHADMALGSSEGAKVSWQWGHRWGVLGQIQEIRDREQAGEKNLVGSLTCQTLYPIFVERVAHQKINLLKSDTLLYNFHLTLANIKLNQDWSLASSYTSRFLTVRRLLSLHY